MPTTRKTERSRTEPIELLLTIVVGIIIIVSGGWNYITVLFGSAVVFGSLLEVREIRLLLKIRVNRITGKQVFQIQDSTIKDSIIAGRDVHIHEAPAPSKSEPSEKTIEQDFSISYVEEYQAIPLEIRKGQSFEGEVSADGRISAYLLRQNSFKSYKIGQGFNYLWSAEGVRRATISHRAETTQGLFLVVEMDEESDEEEVNVSVRLKLKRP